MWTFILRRLLQTAIVLFLFSIVLRGLLDLMPGDPIRMAMFNRPNVKPEDVARLRELWGLDKPFHVKYWRWIQQVVVERDMGQSRTEMRPVADMIPEYTANSLKLMLASFALSLTIAIPLGIYVALRQYSALDYAVGFVSFMGISVPSFWLGILAIYVFAVHLQWFPPGGMTTVGGAEAPGLWDKLHHLILPALVLSVQTIAVWIRYMRASMLEVLHDDYVRTARAKGLSEGRVIAKHALRNALIPIVTLMALSIPALFSGALITETIFAWPGMGRLLYRSVINQDHMVAMIAFLILASLTMLCNLLADLLYAVVDPRIRLS